MILFGYKEELEQKSMYEKTGRYKYCVGAIMFGFKMKNDLVIYIFNKDRSKSSL